MLGYLVFLLATEATLLGTDLLSLHQGRTAEVQIWIPALQQRYKTSHGHSIRKTTTMYGYWQVFLGAEAIVAFQIDSIMFDPSLWIQTLPEDLTT